MEDTKILFHKNKGFIQGIPARELSFDEWKELTAELRALALSSGIYEIDEKVAKSKNVKEGDK